MTAQSAQITIRPVMGNRQRLDGGAMFGNAPRALWERWSSPDSQNRIELACRAMLVQCEGQNFLCETGIGAFFPPKLRERYGVVEEEHVLLDSLAKLGLGEDNIHAVILSHLHFDHAGGLLPPYVESGGAPQRLLFPKAHYVVGAEAWERSMHPHSRDRASFIPELAPLLQASGRLVVVPGDQAPSQLPRAFSFRYSHGHTPGHMHTMVSGQGGSVIFAGDLIPGAAWVHAPITMGYDRFAEQVIDEKLALYDSVIPKQTWIFYTHDPQYAMSRVERTADGKYQAIDLRDDQQVLTL